MRLIAISLLVALLGCGRASEKAPQMSPLEAWEEKTLGCVVRATVEHMNASEAAFDVAAMALSTDRVRAHRHLRHWIGAFAAAAIEPGSRVAARDVLGLAAVAHAEIGDLRVARELADRALAAGSDGSRDQANRAIEVLAWTGDGKRAAGLAGDRKFDRALVASGLARGGDIAGSRKLVAELADEIAAADHATRGLFVMAHVYAGDLAAARALIRAERGPDERAMLYAWASDAMRHTTDAGRGAFLDEAIAEVSAQAEAAASGQSLAAIVWLDLVKARDLVDGDRSARRRLHAWILDPARAAGMVELISFNVVRAEAVGMPEEADRLLAALPPEHRTRAAMDLDLVRGRFDRVFALFATHLAERDALRSRDPGYADGVVEGIDAVEADLWLAFTDAPRDPALIEAFQKLVCR